MSQTQGIRANEKPVENDFSYVYAENKYKGFIKVTKAMMKVLLGVATKLSELENDENFVDNTVSNLKNYYLKTETYSKEELDDKIAIIPKFSVKVVYALPFDDISESTIYLVPANDGSDNLYTEYINVNGLWEILGTQKVPKVEVTKESIESALGYTPADNEEFRQLSDTVNDLKNNGTGTTVTGGSVKTILANIMTIMKAQVDFEGRPQAYSPDISGIVSQTDTLIANLGTSTEEPDTPVNPDEPQPENGIVQTGSVLAITSGITATQTGSVLAIA